MRKCEALLREACAPYNGILSTPPSRLMKCFPVRDALHQDKLVNGLPQSILDLDKGPHPAPIPFTWTDTDSAAAQAIAQAVRANFLSEDNKVRRAEIPSHLSRWLSPLQDPDNRYAPFITMRTGLSPRIVKEHPQAAFLFRFIDDLVNHKESSTGLNARSPHSGASALGFLCVVLWHFNVHVFARVKSDPYVTELLKEFDNLLSSITADPAKPWHSWNTGPVLAAFNAAVDTEAASLRGSSSSLPATDPLVRLTLMDQRKKQSAELNRFVKAATKLTLGASSSTPAHRKRKITTLHPVLRNALMAFINVSRFSITVAYCSRLLLVPYRATATLLRRLSSVPPACPRSSPSSRSCYRARPPVLLKSLNCPGPPQTTLTPTSRSAVSRSMTP